MQQNKPIGVSHRIILNLTALCVIYFTKDAQSCTATQLFITQIVMEAL